MLSVDQGINYVSYRQFQMPFVKFIILSSGIGGVVVSFVFQLLI